MSGGGAFFPSSPAEEAPFGFLGTLPGRRSDDVYYPIEVASEAPSSIPLSLHELDQTQLLEEVKVSLDGPGTPGEPPGQGLHAGPAEAGLVVGVVC